MKKKKMTYEQSGVNYGSLDPAKKLGQEAARKTAKNLTKAGFPEIPDSRGESAFVWTVGDIYMATIMESLGTKNLVADGTREISGKTYYDVIGHDTIASAVNDLVSVGAKPLTVHAFWAVGDSNWFNDVPRIKDLVKGWEDACNLSGATWGGGETPSYNDIVEKKAIALGSSVVGIIKQKKRLLNDKKLKVGDRIILLKSNGVNANGISLTRAIAKKLPKGYGTKLPSGELYGEALLTKTNIYAKLIQELLDANIDLHYISNITGHGLRKIMRARKEFTYLLEHIFEPQEIFSFIQENAGMNDYDMYHTYNMGQDYALFLPEKDVEKTLAIIKKNKFQGIDAGYVKKGAKQVIITPRNITFKGDTLNLR
ncbi:MAG: phosphoribosylformylglycinamidine cyclo-ligase [Candidatus Levybacteria bacterium]|nr:phosphoribosylformylglycinamidine cyclo-ligase [Candidatus Levybacteria bacterium]